MKSYQLAAKSGATRMELAQWLRNLNTLGPVFTMKNLLKLADEMIAGKILDKSTIWFNENWVTDWGPVVLIEIDIEDKWEKLYRECREQLALLDKAVAGDAEAAIQYCRMMANNEIHIGAIS